jgi:hypothetical protein
MMERETLTKMDAAFDATQPTEAMSVAEAMALLGKAIRKASASTDDELRMRTVRAAALADCLGGWAGMVDDEGTMKEAQDGDTCQVPADLLKALRADTDGDTTEPSVSMSDAMAAIGKRLGGGEPAPADGGGAAPEPDISWAPDMTADGDPDPDEDWGADPAGL